MVDGIAYMLVILERSFLTLLEITKFGSAACGARHWLSEEIREAKEAGRRCQDWDEIRA